MCQQNRGRIRGSSLSASTVSDLNDRAFEFVEGWRSRPLACDRPYVFVVGVYLKRAWGGSFENAAVMVGIGVDDDGCREVIGAATEALAYTRPPCGTGGASGPTTP